MTKNPVAPIDVPPALLSELQDLCRKFGKPAVKAAAAIVTRAARGPKVKQDLKPFRDVFRQDARDFLEGRDPIVKRSHYSLAKDFSERNPGQGVQSTHTRVLKKLSAKRPWIIAVTAVEISEDEYPYAAHIRALDEAIKFEGLSKIWSLKRDLAKNAIAQFVEKFGQPDSTKTMAEIRHALKPQTPALLGGLEYLNILGGLPKR